MSEKRWLGWLSISGYGYGYQRTKERAHIQQLEEESQGPNADSLSTEATSAEFKRALQLEACRARSGAHLQFCVLPWISLGVYTGKNLW